MDDNLFEQRTDLENLNRSIALLKNEIGKVIIGQDQMIELLLTGILADGHILIEGVPGVAKTLTAKLLSRTISVGFSRIQFTPDLMPSDVLGTSIFNPREFNFQFKPGPIFSNIVLIDEINRAPAKTQAALFEVMEERQVTVDGQSYKMETPLWCWQLKTRLNRKELTGFRKHNWTGSCSRSMLAIQPRKKNIESLPIIMD